MLKHLKLPRAIFLKEATLCEVAAPQTSETLVELTISYEVGSVAGMN